MGEKIVKRMKELVYEVFYDMMWMWGVRGITWGKPEGDDVMAMGHSSEEGMGTSEDSTPPIDGMVMRNPDKPTVRSEEGMIIASSASTSIIDCTAECEHFFSTLRCLPVINGFQSNCGNRSREFVDRTKISRLNA